MRLDFKKILIQLARIDKSVTDLLECVSRQAIINIQHGKKTQVRVAARLAKYLHCDIIDIMKAE